MEAPYTQYRLGERGWGREFDLNPIGTDTNHTPGEGLLFTLIVWSVQDLFYANIRLDVILLACFRGDFYSEGDFSEWPNTGVATFQGS